MDENRSGDTTLFQDICRGVSELVVVEQIEFHQIAPPNVNCRGYGGVIMLTVRTV
jgi:hypothetical protein